MNPGIRHRLCDCNIESNFGGVSTERADASRSCRRLVDPRDASNAATRDAKLDAHGPSLYLPTARLRVALSPSISNDIWSWQQRRPLPSPTPPPPEARSAPYSACHSRVCSNKYERFIFGGNFVNFARFAAVVMVSVVSARSIRRGVWRGMCCSEGRRNPPVQKPQGRFEVHRF